MALQSLVVTTCSQTWVGFVGCASHEDATQCLPLAWCLTDLMFTPGHSKAITSTLTLPWTDKMVSCVVTDWHSKSEDKLFLSTALTVSLEFLWQKPTKEQKTYLNQRVHHSVWLSFSWPFLHLCWLVCSLCHVLLCSIFKITRVPPW